MKRTQFTKNIEVHNHQQESHRSCRTHHALLPRKHKRKLDKKSTHIHYLQQERKNNGNSMKLRSGNILKW
jgi:hypothetical protein